MISFFRKIRQNILKQGKTTRYFKYALGEILLVVIGILIALQINNWNEARKQKKEDLIFLKNLKEELSLDITALVKHIGKYKQLNSELQASLNILNDAETINQEQRELISKSFNILEILTPINKNTQRNDLQISNGSMHRISETLNQNFINYIDSTKTSIEIISKLGESLQLLSIHDVSPMFDLVTDGTRTTYSFDFDEIKNNRLVKNAISKSLRYRNISIQHMSSQIEKTQKLIYEIDQLLELENKQ
jgi:hypothetical protein